MFGKPADFLAKKAKVLSTELNEGVIDAYVEVISSFATTEL
jgi:hypothetical protein